MLSQHTAKAPLNTFIGDVHLGPRNQVDADLTAVSQWSKPKKSIYYDLLVYMSSVSGVIGGVYGRL